MSLRPGLSRLRVTTLLSLFGTLLFLPGNSGVRADDPWTATAILPSSSDTQVREDISPALPVGPQQEIVAIIKLDEQPLASYTGGVPGLAATSPEVTGAAKLDLNSAASQAYLAYLAQRHADFAVRLAIAVPGARIVYDLNIVVGGMVAAIPAASLKDVERIQGVEVVLPDRVERLQSDSTAFIGATSVWAQLGGQDDAGEGVIVGVLDSGIWPEHPSVSDPDPAGNAYLAPPPALDGSRACEFSGGANPGPAFSCNNKLIGADRFMATYDAVIGLLPSEFTSARDDNGHGTHTLTTAAGNGDVDASFDGRPLGAISGIAPRAQVIAYKVCGDAGCFQSDSVAAIQEAIEDGVDVLNFSISGGNTPYADAVELAFLDAYSAGVFVAASAGNAGPGADTNSHAGPWVTTVAASTSNSHYLTTLSLLASNGDTLNLTGSSITRGTPASMSLVMPPAASAACDPSTPFGAGTFTASTIVVCQRLAGARILKSWNVSEGGGGAMILLNADPVGQRLDEFTDNHYVPTVHLSYAEGQSLLAFVSGHSGITASFGDSASGPVQADRLTAFSSRGGPGQSIGVSKPDVTAPGIQILAGNTGAGATELSGPQGEIFQAIAGTSMSSPHVAGAGALLKALHPDWTPGQIKSALMTTANRNVTKEDGVTPATPFDTGSGRIDLNNADDPGFTISATAVDYASLQDDLWNANYPSVYVPILAGKVTLARTLTSVSSQTRSWNVQVKDVPADLSITTSPKVIQLKPGEEGTLSITIDAKNVPLGAVRHARIEVKSGNMVGSIPVTIVRRETPVTLTKTCTPNVIYRTGNQSPNTTTCTITAQNNLFVDAAVSIIDDVPKALRVVDGSVTGGTQSGNRVSFDGNLSGAQPPDVSIAPGSSPAGGYLPLSAFGISPIGGVGDETVVNFDVPPFTFAGETYSRIGVVSNGYVVVGGGTSADINFINQNLPDGTRPNNVLAPFWTDLNPASGGAIRIGSLTDGVDTWIVVDWAGVREYSTPATATFQIWIGVGGLEDISYAFGPISGNGDGGFLTTGVENRFGNRGAMTYFNGIGTLPSNGMTLRVTSAAPTPGEAHVITFSAAAQSRADVVNFAHLSTSVVAGTVTASAAISIR